MHVRTGRNYGTAAVSASEPLIVGRCATLVIRYRLGDYPIRKGGGLVVFVPRAGWSMPRFFAGEQSIAGLAQAYHLTDNSATGYVWVSTPAPGVRLSFSGDPPKRDMYVTNDQGDRLCETGSHPGYPIYIRVEEGELAPGQEVEVLYGDTGSGSPGTVCGTYAHRAYFHVWVDPDGTLSGVDMGYLPIDNPPYVDVMSDTPRKLVVTVPSVVAPGDPLPVHVAVRDRYENVVTAAPYQFAVQAPADTVHQSTAGPGLFAVGGLAAGAGPVARVQVREGVHGLRAASNPALVAAGMPYKLFWGDFHGHCNLDDAINPVEYMYEYARDAARLDVAGCTIHGEMITPEVWRETMQVNRRFNAPGRFVTLPGYEWSELETVSGRPGWRYGGHRNVYFPDEGAGVFVHPYEEGITSALDLFRRLEHANALVIPHHTAHPMMHTDWDLHHPRLQRLVEIYSQWGASEYAGNPRPVCRQHLRETPRPQPGTTVQEGLARGLRLGFTGGADTHSGQLGYSDYKGRFARRRAYHNGITGIWAPELTRPAIWEALHARRCYATTGNRMVIQFNLEHHWMGAEVSLQAEPELRRRRRLHLRVLGCAELAQVEVVRNNQVVHTVTAGGADLEAEWEDAADFARVALAPTAVQPAPFLYYYLRVTQADGEMGWSSPIWVS